MMSKAFCPSPSEFLPTFVSSPPLIGLTEIMSDRSLATIEIFSNTSLNLGGILIS